MFFFLSYNCDIAYGLHKVYKGEHVPSITYVNNFCYSDIFRLGLLSLFLLALFCS